jgi:hypothetical protein
MRSIALVAGGTKIIVRSKKSSFQIVLATNIDSRILDEANFAKTGFDANASRLANFGEMRTADVKRSNREVKSTRGSSASFVILCVRLDENDEIKLDESNIDQSVLSDCLFV